MKKVNRLLIALLAALTLVAITAGTGSAIHWVCGYVYDAIDCEDGAWHIVHIYYEGDEGNYRACEVNPD